VYDRFYKIRDWIKKYERHLSSLALISGFIIDALTLKRVDTLYENAVILCYFTLITIGILTLNLVEARKLAGLWWQRISPFLPLLIQFAFGGLFSGFTIFYFRSGSVASSWPFILVLVALLFGNEFFKRQYSRLVFQVTIFFVSLFFFTIFFIPILVNDMGSWVFILSGATAVALITIFVYVLSVFVPERIHQNRRYLVISIATFFIAINLLYFTNLIPPIPLSLKNAGVYHEIVRTPDGYTATEEVLSQWNSWQFFENIHIKEGEPLYVYSAVFAPHNLKTGVVHNWRYFDDEEGRWVSVSKIPYTIVGGTDRGHRGYSMKTNLKEGAWTVNVETVRGQVIGRITFEVVFDDQEPPTRVKTL
jgi:hypothetical protein